MPDYYTLKQASEVTGVSTRTLGDWCRSGKWKGIAYKANGKWVIPCHAVQEKPDYAIDDVMLEIKALQTKLDMQDELLRELFARVKLPATKRAFLVSRIKALLKSDHRTRLE